MNKNSIFYFCFLLILTCKDQGILEKLIIEKGIDIHNKFPDSYINNRYINNSLKMNINFNSLWKILISYDKLDEYQKKLFDYFNSSLSEALFIGYNDSLKLGVRCIVENIGYTNTEYRDIIKQNNAQEFSNYKVKFLKEEEIVLPNISGINLIYKIEINIHNVFIYNTLLFKKEKSNIRLDFWCKESKYEKCSNEISEIFNSIDFFSKNADSIEEVTPDNNVEIYLE